MKKRIIALVLVVAQLFMAWSMSIGVSAASARSARKVLKDIISVKEEWDDAETQEEMSKLHEEADELREELIITKEYRKDIKVSDRNILLSDGDDPGFRKMVDVLCFEPYDSKENVEKVLDYLNAYDESFWGTICIACGGIIFTGALIYGAVEVAPKVIAGAGMKAAEWETAVSGAMTVLAEETNRISHILQEKHLWEYIVSSPSWESIRTIVNDVMLYGADVILCNGKPGKELLISGEIVQIQYAIIDGVLKIVNGWIVK